MCFDGVFVLGMKAGRRKGFFYARFENGFLLVCQRFVLGKYLG